LGLTAILRIIGRPNADTMRIEKQQLGIFAALIVMIAVFAMLQYWPMHSRAHAIEQVKAAQLSAETKVDEQAKKLPALKTQLAQLEAQVGNYDAKIPADRELGAFLQEIADVMNKYDLKEQVVQPESEMQADTLMCIPVRIQCKGTADQLFAFLKSFRNLQRLIRIERVQFKNTLEMNGIVMFDARVNIYYRQPKQQGGSL
jgi:Tfp pilus assembly protein PilO